MKFRWVWRGKGGDREIKKMDVIGGRANEIHEIVSRRINDCDLLMSRIVWILVCS